MTDSTVSKATLVNLRYIDGELKQVFIDSNGKEVVKDIEGVKKRETVKESSTDFEYRFTKTSTVPVTDVGPKTSPLIKKNIAKEYTHAVHDQDAMMEFIQRHMDMVISFHAMLIEILGAPENFDDERASVVRSQLNKNTALKAYVLKHMQIMGDVWAPAYKKLTNTD
jgi:hypothetical protein